MLIFDANMILRYLLNDNIEMAERAERFLKEEEVFVTIEVIAEVIYVLKGVYGIERRRIADTLKDFLHMVQSQNMDVLKFAVDTYGEKNIDFVDCVLYAYYKINDATIATFDKKLLKLLNNGTMNSSD